MSIIRILVSNTMFAFTNEVEEEAEASCLCFFYLKNNIETNSLINI